MSAPGLIALWREDVACVFERDPAARNTWEVLATYPGVHAILSHRLAHALWRRNWKFGARLLSFLSRWWTTIEIHPGATIGRRFFIDHGAGVVVGETAEIGDDVTLYHGVTLGGTSWSKGKRHPTLESGVVVGSGAKILGPLTIGKDSKIGANSVVVGDVPGGCTVVGIPGRVVQSARPGHLNPFGIDLNHHLIPDPVAEALACLMERVRQLEAKVDLPHEDGQEAHCMDCETSPICGTQQTETVILPRHAVGE
ncbi:serine O-acetyltransferase [Magnetospira thiophila]